MVFFTVDGAWSIWSNWGDCSLTCGDDGSRDRQRSCSTPAPQFGGSECIGNNTETGSCEDTPCASKIIQQDMKLFFFQHFFLKMDYICASAKLNSLYTNNVNTIRFTLFL